MNPLAQEDWVRTPVLELNWSELEVVVAGEGGHCVGRGPPPCLVYATVYPSQTPSGRVDAGNLIKAAHKAMDINRRSSRSTID